MSEMRAPYWVFWFGAVPALRGRGWYATVEWQDVINRRRLRRESPAVYPSRVWALRAAETAAADDALLDRLAAEVADARETAHFPVTPVSLRVILPNRSFVEWERVALGRLDEK